MVAPHAGAAVLSGEERDFKVDAIARLKLTMEYDVVRSLMSGNDTMCFSTRQYVEQRDVWIKEMIGDSREELGLGPIDEYDLETARRQLLAIPQLVREVEPDVWTATSDQSPSSI
jgi:hypothetical protein